MSLLNRSRSHRLKDSGERLHPRGQERGPAAGRLQRPAGQVSAEQEPPAVLMEHSELWFMQETFQLRMYFKFITYSRFFSWISIKKKKYLKPTQVHFLFLYLLLLITGRKKTVCIKSKYYSRNVFDLSPVNGHQSTVNITAEDGSSAPFRCGRTVQHLTHNHNTTARLALLHLPPSSTSTHPDPHFRFSSRRQKILSE